MTTDTPRKNSTWPMVTIKPDARALREAVASNTAAHIRDRMISSPDNPAQFDGLPASRIGKESREYVYDKYGKVLFSITTKQFVTNIVRTACTEKEYNVTFLNRYDIEKKVCTRLYSIQDQLDHSSSNITYHGDHIHKNFIITLKNGNTMTFTATKLVATQDSESTTNGSMV